MSVGTSPVIRWLGVHTFTARGKGMTPMSDLCSVLYKPLPVVQTTHQTLQAVSMQSNQVLFLSLSTKGRVSAPRHHTHQQAGIWGW